MYVLLVLCRICIPTGASLLVYGSQYEKIWIDWQYISMSHDQKYGITSCSIEYMHVHEDLKIFFKIVPTFIINDN